MSKQQQINIPDLGGADGACVIEVFAAVGDTLAIDDPILLLEGDKATMEIPSPVSGKVQALLLKEGDVVKTGTPLIRIDVAGVEDTSPVQQPSSLAPTDKPSATSTPPPPPTTPQPRTSTEPDTSLTTFHAGPAVRRLAHALDIDLRHVQGRGPKGRIRATDVYAAAKAKLASGGPSAPVPSVCADDFKPFGATTLEPLNKIKRATARHLTDCWQHIPHVTQFHSADITALEAFRQANKVAVEKQGGRLTPLVFIMKALVHSLKAFPTFNASLDTTNQQLILKQYYHVGIAVDTPNGLVVPVIRDVDQKSVSELAHELVSVSEKARASTLGLKAMQGGCMTISSLGGLGVGPFTPIVNAPELAILAVGKAEMKPVYQEGGFVPRLILPLCLSYDHRVIDGAEGARFIRHLADHLSGVCIL